MSVRGKVSKFTLCVPTWTASRKHSSEEQEAHQPSSNSYRQSHIHNYILHSQRKRRQWPKGLKESRVSCGGGDHPNHSCSHSLGKLTWSRRKAITSHGFQEESINLQEESVSIMVAFLLLSSIILLRLMISSWSPVTSYKEWLQN